MAVTRTAAASAPSSPVASAAPSTQLLSRIRSEYAEMPGLRLTLLQARRLWGLDVLTCSAALAALESAGYLTRTRDGAYVLAGAERRTA
jgi:hypothetical protein